METQNFDHLLENIRKEKLPECPSRIADTTLRRIRQLPDTSADARWSYLLNIFVRPQMVAILLAVAVTISVVTTTLASGLNRNDFSSQANANDPLGLRVLVNPASLECLPHCACGIECACGTDSPLSDESGFFSPPSEQ